MGQRFIPKSSATTGTATISTTTISVATISTVKIVVAEISVAWVSLAEMSIAETVIAEIVIAEISSAEVSVPKMSIAEIVIAEISSAEVPVSKMSIAEIANQGRGGRNPIVACFLATTRSVAMCASRAYMLAISLLTTIFIAMFVSVPIAPTFTTVGIATARSPPRSCWAIGF